MEPGAANVCAMNFQDADVRCLDIEDPASWSFHSALGTFANCTGFPCQNWAREGDQSGSEGCTGRILWTIPEFVRCILQPVYIFENIESSAQSRDGHYRRWLT